MSAEQYLAGSKRTINRLKGLCITCDTPSAFGFSSQTGDSSSTGKSLLALGNSTDTINATTIETINLISQNTESQIINGDVAQFYTLEVVEIRGFRATGDIDFNGANMVNINIDSGTLDNVVIGGDDPADGTFEDLRALGVSGYACFDWNSELDTLSICGAIFVTGAINFGASGTNIYGDGSDLYMSVTGQYFQDINQGHNLTIGGTQTLIVGQDQIISISGSTNETFGTDLTTIVGKDFTTTVNNAYDLDVGSTLAMESFGPMTLLSHDDLNLHADGCLNITADCLNMTIGGTSQFIFEDTVAVVYENDLGTTILGDETKQLAGSLNYYIGSTAMMDIQGNYDLDVIGDMLIDVTGCFILNTDCMNIDIATTASINADNYALFISGSLTTIVQQDENKTIIGNLNTTITGSNILDVKTNYDIDVAGCFVLNVGCLDINVATTASIDVEDDYDLSISGSLTTIIQQDENKTINGSHNMIVGSTMTTTVEGEYLLSTTGDIKLYAETKTIRLLEDSCILLGTDISICGVSGNIEINSLDDILFNVTNVSIPDGGNLNVSCLNLGTSEVQICGDNSNLDIFVTGCINQTIGKCVDINIGASYSFDVGSDAYINITDNLTTGVTGNNITTVNGTNTLIVQTDNNIFVHGAQIIGITGSLTSSIGGDYTTNVTNEYDLVVGSTLAMGSLGQMSLSSNDDLNLHADGCLNITAECLNIDIVGGVTTIIGGDLTTTVIGAETKQNNNFDWGISGNLSTIINGFETKQILNYYDLSVGSTGSMSFDDNLTIVADNGLNLSISGGPMTIDSLNDVIINAGATVSIITDTYILGVTNDIIIEAGSTYGLDANNISQTAVNDLTLTAGNCITLNAPCLNLGGTVTLTGSVVLPEAVEQQWIKFNDFDTIGTTQAVISVVDREIGISGAGEWYRNFCYDIEESFYIAYDITHKVLAAGNKGFKLQSIKPYYEMVSDELNSASVNIIKHTFESFDPSAGRTGVPLGFDDTELNNAIGVTRHRPNIGVSGEFLKDSETIMVEFCFDKKLAADMHFYGMTIEFTTIT